MPIQALTSQILGQVIHLFAVLLLGCLAVSCETSPEASPPPTGILAESGNLFAAMRGVESVSLHPSARLVQPRPGQSASTVQHAMDRALTDIFRSRGYAMLAGRQGEREIAYAIGIEGEMSDAEMVDIFGISPGIDDYREGERGGIVMVVIHPLTRSILWRGSASGVGDGPEPGSPEFGKSIRTAVELILRDLPLRP